MTTVDRALARRRHSVTTHWCSFDPRGRAATEAEAPLARKKRTVMTTRVSPTALRRWALVLTGIGSLMAALDTLVVSTALSTIRLDFGASVEQLEWTVNGYNLTFAVLLITAA